MSPYKKVVEHFEVVGQYESPILGNYQAVSHLARIAVLGPDETTFWERTVCDRIISFSIPIPFFDKRLDRVATRADNLVEKLNSEI